MDPETLSATNENMYRVVLMLLQCITMMVGLGSGLLMVICAVIAAYDYFAEMGRSARRQIKKERRFGSEKGGQRIIRLNSFS